MRLNRITATILMMILCGAGTASAVANPLEESCCACDCEIEATNNLATTSSGIRASGPLVCFDDLTPSDCQTQCSDLGCSAGGFAEIPCGAVPGCDQGQEMAPVASVAGLLGLGTLLAALGIYATARRRA